MLYGRTGLRLSVYGGAGDHRDPQYRIGEMEDAIMHWIAVIACILSFLFGLFTSIFQTGCVLYEWAVVDEQVKEAQHGDS